MLTRVFVFHLVIVVAFGNRSRSVNEKFRWLRSVHLKDSGNIPTVSNKLHAGDTISRSQNVTTGLEPFDTVPQTIETSSSTKGKVAEIGVGNEEFIEPYQDITKPPSNLLDYLLTWKGEALPLPPDLVTSSMSGENNVTNMSSMQTDVIGSSDGMLVDQRHRSLILDNGKKNPKVKIDDSEDNSKRLNNNEGASSSNETKAQSHVLNSIDGSNSTLVFQKSRLYDMISITKFIIVIATVSCAVILIIALIFGISSIRKRRDVTLRDVKTKSFQKTDSDLLKVIPREDKDTFMGIPSNNQIWKELQIIENLTPTPSVKHVVEVD